MEMRVPEKEQPDRANVGCADITPDLGSGEGLSSRLNRNLETFEIGKRSTKPFFYPQVAGQGRINLAKQ